MEETSRTCSPVNSNRQNLRKLTCVQIQSGLVFIRFQNREMVLFLQKIPDPNDFETFSFISGITIYNILPIGLNISPKLFPPLVFSVKHTSSEDQFLR